MHVMFVDHKGTRVMHHHVKQFLLRGNNLLDANVAMLLAIPETVPKTEDPSVNTKSFGLKVGAWQMRRLWSDAYCFCVSPRKTFDMDRNVQMRTLH